MTGVGTSKFPSVVLAQHFEWSRDRDRPDPVEVPMCTACVTPCVRCGEQCQLDIMMAVRYGICLDCHKGVT